MVFKVFVKFLVFVNVFVWVDIVNVDDFINDDEKPRVEPLITIDPPLPAELPDDVILPASSFVNIFNTFIILIKKYIKFNKKIYPNWNITTIITVAWIPIDLNTNTLDGSELILKSNTTNIVPKIDKYIKIFIIYIYEKIFIIIDVKYKDNESLNSFATFLHAKLIYKNIRQQIPSNVNSNDLIII